MSWNPSTDLGEDHPLVTVLAVTSMLSVVSLIICMSAALEGGVPWSICGIVFIVTVVIVLLYKWADSHYDRVHDRAFNLSLRSSGSSASASVHARIVSSPPQPPPPIETEPIPPPPAPKVDTLTVVELESIRDTCLREFHKKPLLHSPPVSIEPDSYWTGRKALASYHSVNDTIQFNEQYLAEKPSFDDVCDTMTHELIHAWLYQHGIQKPGMLPHGEHFEVACHLLGIPYNPIWTERDKE